MASESSLSFEQSNVECIVPAERSPAWRQVAPSRGSIVEQQITAKPLEGDTPPLSPTGLPVILMVSDPDVSCVQDILERGEGGEVADTSKANTPDIDPSLLFGMERTLYSAVNVGALVIMFGFGLMMVSNARFQHYYTQGCIIVVAGLVFIGCSWLTHCRRMWIVSQRGQRRGRQVTILNSAAWTGCLVFLMCVCIGFELYYGYTNPYMERSMPVDVNNPDSGLPAMTTSAP